MKSLVLTSTFPRWKNDTTPSFVYELSRRLAEKGHKIIALAPHAEHAFRHEDIGKVDVHRFRYFYPPKLEKLAYGAGIIPNFKKSLIAKLNVPFFLLAEYFSAMNVIDREKPDIIHAHWLIPQGIVGAMLKDKKTKLVVTVHGSDLFPLKNFVFKFFQKKVLKAADFCTVNSQATAYEIIKRFPQYEDKILLIPMGVDTKLFFPRKVSFRKYKKQKIILFVGRLNEQKGLEYLIRAMPAVNKKIKNCKLLVIGQGDYRIKMQKLANSLNANNVEFLGAIPHRNLADYYNLADVFVLPAVTSKIGTEGQGLVLLEAMACGSAVVGTETGGVRFIVKNNDNGLLVREKDENELSEAVVKLILDKKLRQKLGRNGAKFVRQNYSWDVIVNKFNQMYNELK